MLVPAVPAPVVRLIDLMSAVMPGGTVIKRWLLAAVETHLPRTAERTVIAVYQVLAELRGESWEWCRWSGTPLAQAFRGNDRMRYTVGPFELPLTNDAGP